MSNMALQAAAPASSCSVDLPAAGSHSSPSNRSFFSSLAFSSSSLNHNTASLQLSSLNHMHKENLSFTSQKLVNAVQGSTQAAAAAALATAPSPASANRIASTMANLKMQGKVALIPYLTAGDPNLDTTAEAMRLLDTCGCDIIELGVPYSDPIADGPVIRASATRSLAQGTTLEKVLSMLQEVVPDLKAPVVLFTYYNPILNCGMEAFSKAVKAAGASGLLVPDLPLEETDNLHEFTVANDLELIRLTTPTTQQSHVKDIAQASEGFVYLVSLTGVTGPQDFVHPQVENLLAELKQVTTKSVVVGFGISRPEHVSQLVKWGADGVIVGSAMVKRLGEAATPEEGCVSLEKFARELKAALPN
ncbi:unnamed protein product [Sphagnum troendelagicum]|uniref:tryptophan synthase n=1 Tax=Sphagnum troendelagicum TaxID=128251 RepID=A0ABP0UG89_9BRYO